jgi:hypothetical protein
MGRSSGPAFSEITSRMARPGGGTPFLTGIRRPDDIGEPPVSNVRRRAPRSLPTLTAPVIGQPLSRHTRPPTLHLLVPSLRDRPARSAYTGAALLHTRAAAPDSASSALRADDDAGLVQATRHGSLLPVVVVPPLCVGTFHSTQSASTKAASQTGGAPPSLSARCDGPGAPSAGDRVRGGAIVRLRRLGPSPRRLNDRAGSPTRSIKALARAGGIARLLPVDCDRPDGVERTLASGRMHKRRAQRCLPGRRRCSHANAAASRNV